MNKVYTALLNAIDFIHIDKFAIHNMLYVALLNDGVSILMLTQIANHAVDILNLDAHVNQIDCKTFQSIGNESDESIFFQNKLLHTSVA